MSINRISLYHLETLIWIARLGSFGAAAERLNATQPTISARVAELEQRLGATLFQKNGRAMTLTPAGRELVREYTPLWEQLQDVLLRSSGFGQIRGTVRIGAGEIAAVTCLPSFIADLKRYWPELNFEVDIELTAPLIQALLNGQSDLAFAAGSVAHPGLRSMPIGAAELAWVASPSVASRLVDDASLHAISLWSLRDHSPLNHVVRSTIARIGGSPRQLNLCNNVRMMIDIVTAGDGFALVPQSMVASQLQYGTLMRIFPQERPDPIMFHVISRAAEADPVILEVLRCAKDIRLEPDETLAPRVLTP